MSAPNDPPAGAAAPRRQIGLRRFLTRLIWLSVLPLLLLAIGLAVRYVQSVEEDLDAEAALLARNTARAIDFELGARLAALQSLSLSGEADDPALWAEFHDEARRLQQVLDTHVLFAGADRVTRFHTRIPYGAPVPAIPKVDGRSAVDEAIRTGRPQVSNLVHGPVLDTMAVGLVAPGLRDGQVRFLLVGTVPARQLEHRLRAINLPTGWRLELRDALGATIASSGAPAAGNGSDREMREDVERAPWTLTLTVPGAVRDRAVLAASMTMLAALLGATLIAVLGGHWAARRLATSMHSLLPGSAPGHRGPAIAEILAVQREMDESRRERDDARAAGALQEAQLRAVVETATDAIVTVDESQRIVMANSAAARMFGYAVADLRGAPLERLLPGRYRGQPLQRLLAVEAVPSAADRASDAAPELDGLRADGTEFPIEVAVSSAQVDGTRLHTAILRDVTERKRAEEAVRESRARLQAALASMSDAVMIVDARGRVLEVSDACAAFHRIDDPADCPHTMAGYARLVAIERPDGTPLPAEDWPVARALRGESEVNAEYRLRRTDTDARWVGSYSFAPILAPGGEVVGAVVAGRDVTALKDMQAELEASHADLRRLVAAQDSVQESERSRIARELHDDLQQTLAAIRMEAAALCGDVEPSSRRVGEAAARIERLASTGIVSTRRIVNDLRPAILEELGLVPALRSMVGDFVRRTGLACEFDASGVPEADEPRLAPVATCLYRVAQEALNNVHKHAGAHEVHVELARRGDALLRMTVSDDGAGLQPGDRRKPGSYGLMGMDERVRAVGGSLSVRGGPGAGTSVVGEVALAPAADAPARDG